ncbi:MAG: ribbon-helix-helix protein, CopG family [Acidobacteria bacterium]|nr:ribbon-helix-helix protein, CopG family [Acidobacteriota bacterium]
MSRVTFSLDDATVAQIRLTAARLRKAQSHVVRDAVADYATRTDRLSERERLHLMGVLERLRDAGPTRPVSRVDAELRAIRSARRAGGRRHRSA